MLVDSETESSSSGSTSSRSDDSMGMQPTSQTFIDAMADLYSRCYLKEGRPITKTLDNIHILLREYKLNRPEIFCSHVRVTPESFDSILAAICHDPIIFHNNSQNEQHPVDKQLAVTLYCFSHFGNTASTLKVALWAGIGYSTVDWVTKHIMVAVCREEFHHATLHWPDGEEKKAVKEWVEANSCPAWRDGWLMVYGTLVPLFSHPRFYGNTWYDRKSNYSMNVQVHPFVRLTGMRFHLITL
jgi:hypothetical protein